MRAVKLLFILVFGIFLISIVSAEECQTGYGCSACSYENPETFYAEFSGMKDCHTDALISSENYELDQSGWEYGWFCGWEHLDGEDYSGEGYRSVMIYDSIFRVSIGDTHYFEKPLNEIPSCLGSIQINNKYSKSDCNDGAGIYRYGGKVVVNSCFTENCVKITSEDNCMDVNGIYQFVSKVHSYDTNVRAWEKIISGDKRRLILSYDEDDEVLYGMQLYNGTPEAHEIFYLDWSNSNIDVSSGVAKGTAELNGDENYCFGKTASVEFDVDCSAKTYNVSLKLDPEYISKTKEERYFTPKPTEITPFDDVVCELETDDEIQSYTGRLVTIDSSGVETEILRGTYQFSRQIEKNEKTYNILLWKIDGWNSGWTSDNVIMEKVVSNQNIKCIAEINSQDVESDVIKTSNCVHLWGPDGSVYDDEGIMPMYLPAEFNYIEMRGKSYVDKTSHFTPSYFIKNYDAGFGEIDPFKTYKYNFAYYADLKEHDDTTWPIFISPLGHKTYILNGKRVEEASSCNLVRRGGSYFDFLQSRTSVTHTMTYSKFIFSLGPSWATNTKVHEFGHAFCGLFDEYTYVNAFIPFLEGAFVRNCQFFKGSFGEYGQDNLG